jgi:L-ascorbate metabolism protein UlaG (beta-lactamase superfamily)
LACSEKSVEDKQDRQISVHYIANEGFLLESNGIKVLIDGLFNTGLDRYSFPDPVLISDMIHHKLPFSDIDYLFFTHNHPDHFNDSLTITFMMAQPGTIMVCPSQVYDQLRYNHAYDTDLENRIIIVTPDSGQVETRNFEKFRFKACRTRHSDTYSIENNAYVMDFWGVKVFHSGDSWKEALNEWEDFDIHTEDIDLALVNGFYAGDGYKLLNEQMAPSQIILIHMKNEHLDMFTDIMAKDTAVFHNSTMFKESMESKTFKF